MIFTQMVARGGASPPDRSVWIRDDGYLSPHSDMPILYFPSGLSRDV